MRLGAIIRRTVEAHDLLMHANNCVNHEHMQHANMGGYEAGRAQTSNLEATHDEW